MREISLHILDIAKNSVRAKATLITLGVEVDDAADTLVFSVKDNGCGMSEELLKTVTDPFTTTRTTRKVGLGLPLLRTNTELTGGGIEITSTVGVGTLVKATFGLSSIDRMPLGDLSETVITLVSGSPEVDFVLNVKRGEQEFCFDTAAIKQMLGVSVLDEAEVLQYLTEYVRENIVFIKDI
ncbi:MAG: ATP-binding protein [Clostridia bacterium]|nr:ATP-binding protein [Clostridia bacterium]